MDPVKAAILIVDDEPLLRMAAFAMVEDAGFEAIEAADATEAIAILESRSDIRLVFTDIEMPQGIDGLKLAALIRHRWPPIVVVVTSGRYLAREMPASGFALFFAKPYRERDVIAAFRRLII